MNDKQIGLPGCCGITRRSFLLGASAGLAVGGPLGWMGLKGWQSFAQAHRPAQVAIAPVSEGMPGRFPGRVVEVRHEGSVDDLHRIDAAAVKQMIDRGMCELTGENGAVDAWKSKKLGFCRDDVVGIKVNPVGRGPKPGEWRVPGAVGSISSPAVLVEIVRALKNDVGIPARNIIVFERYADEFIDAGYEELMRTRDMDGVRWYASAFRYDDQQVAIDGQLPGNRHPNVVGYDPDQFVEMGFAAPQHDAKDDRRTRSHLSLIVSKMCSKIITIPVLKDHRSAGVTMALKNMSHGFNNNVARSHIGTMYRRDGATNGPNQCNTFIPAAVNQPQIRQKATLHIMDGLIGVYEGGPGCWNRTWGTWHHKGLFFATDPVAMDHVGWEIIDAKRAQFGFSPVAQMGQFRGTPMVHVSPNQVAMMVGGTPLGAAGMLADYQYRRRVHAEQFNLRQPEHVILAGMIGLGTWDAARIEHTLVRL